MTEEKHESPWVTVIAWIILLGVTAFLIFICWKIIQVITAIITWIQHLTPSDWNMLGEIARNTSGWVALLAAIGTITAMLVTNKTRAKEAASSEFRDQMQWATDSLAEGNPIKTAYAQLIIERYANNKPKLLDKWDHQHALDMWDMTLKLYGEDDPILDEQVKTGHNNE